MVHGLGYPVTQEDCLQTLENAEQESPTYGKEKCEKVPEAVQLSHLGRLGAIYSCRSSGTTATFTLPSLQLSDE